MEYIWGLKNSKRMIATPWVSNLVLYDKTSQSPDVMLVVIAMHVLRLISSRLQIQAATESVGGHQPGPYACSACMEWAYVSLLVECKSLCILSEEKFKGATDPIRKKNSEVLPVNEGNPGKVKYVSLVSRGSASLMNYRLWIFMKVNVTFAQKIVHIWPGVVERSKKQWESPFFSDSASSMM